MNKLTITLATTLMLTAGSVLAAGQDPKAPEPMDHGKMNMEKSADPAKNAAEFATLDSNKDGRLSKTEVASNSTLVKHFAMLDANTDGSLSPSEFAKHHDM